MPHGEPGAGAAKKPPIGPCRCGALDEEYSFEYPD